MLVRRLITSFGSISNNQGLSLEQIQAFPKVELHAHVTASIPRPAFSRLLASKKLDSDLKFIDQASTNEELFRGVFGRLSKAIQHTKDLRWITREVLDAFEQDNVRYIEFRSTAKKLEDMRSELQYVEAILEEIEQWQGSTHNQSVKQPKIEARYLLSLNRAYKPEAFYEVIKHVKSDKGWAKYVTGLDYSGDPWTRDITDYRKCIELAREAGLKLSIHTGEFVDQMPETPRILDFKPERLGHFIYYTPEEFQLVKDRKIVIESCPTSNLRTSPNLSLAEHPISKMYAAGQLLTVCTDDRLIFDKSLSEEIHMVTSHFGYQKEFLKKLSLDGMRGAFISSRDSQGQVIQQRIILFKNSFVLDLCEGDHSRDSGLF